MALDQKVVNALIWMKETLESNGIEYQIVGGTAARAHGGSRPVADIDLYIDRNDAPTLMPLVADYVTKPLTHHRGNQWDLEYVQLTYDHQKIEIGLSPGAKIKDNKSNDWFAQDIDFTRSVTMSLAGISFSCMPKEDLIEYKSRLAREVDLIDIQELS